jgi:phage FluMu protein Com
MRTVNMPVTTIQVPKKKITGVSLPFRVLSMVIGILGLLFGVLLCLTILGIPFAIFCFIGSVGFIAAAKGHQKVQCPHCKYDKNYVANGALNFKCRKCKNLTVIDWVSAN